MYAIREVRKAESGRISIDIPVPLRDRAIEIIILPVEEMPTDASWPSGFFDETAGCFADNPLIREEQGDYPEREEIK